MKKIIPLLLILAGCSPAPDYIGNFEKSCEGTMTRSITQVSGYQPRITIHCNDDVSLTPITYRDNDNE